MTGRIFFDCFSSSLVDLPKHSRTTLPALRSLSLDPRVSCFEQSEHPWIPRLLRELRDDGLIVSDPAEPYPWSRYTLTDKGRAMLGDGREVG